jgi:uncharacterized protein YbjT (DUF2867 family)
VHVRPTGLLEGFFLMFTADSVRESHQIRRPFGEGKTPPVAVEDVARAIAARLANPQPHLGKIDHLAPVSRRCISATRGPDQRSEPPAGRFAS